ncbi:chromatin assembly factor 1 subunit A-domain-containing protein [Halteromyces radiatus]|uniref:chromatin assembly factor 1 subunit A-domain-containing protein n=1 Tax=Halteromyces radiatus TaxID=101107 RepID=UPI00221E840B|nr:chromatin assembly factor 1 subunit A-domain-containing protein [Halteromyces radiatus]KAI8080025.1 chromatin assembly factor 1 subunit A-domain-containing protein [Halteromyces radiatus]
MKLLQFTEDVRPAYYGTWTKLSNSISPKNPFTKDTELIDYEHDSEAEWEPEGEGDDIQSGEEDEDDIVPEGNDPEDVGWLVPEGYLSEGEGVNDSDEDGMSKIVQRLSVRPKSRKNIASRPIIIGPIFENDDDMDQNEPLKPFGIRMLFDSNNNSNGYDPFAIIEKKSNSTDNNGSNNKTNGFTSEHAEALINIIQGKVDGMTKLVTEAKANSLLCEFPKTQIEAKIRDIAIKEKRGNDTKSAWYAKTQVKNLPS